MCDTIEVAVSGAVGKQVIARPISAGVSTLPFHEVILESVILNVGTTSAKVVIRDGNASGDVKLTVTRNALDSQGFEVDDLKFTKGMHVKVIGTGALAYLVID